MHDRLDLRLLLLLAATGCAPHSIDDYVLPPGVVEVERMGDATPCNREVSALQVLAPHWAWIGLGVPVGTVSPSFCHEDSGLSSVRSKCAMPLAQLVEQVRDTGDLEAAAVLLDRTAALSVLEDGSDIARTPMEVQIATWAAARALLKLQCDLGDRGCAWAHRSAKHVVTCWDGPGTPTR